MIIIIINILKIIQHLNHHTLHQVHQYKLYSLMKFDGPTRVLVLFYDLPKDDSSSELSQTGLKIVLIIFWLNKFPRTIRGSLHFGNSFQG
ncbi:hypothetical protein DDB_G0287941 [Dictyostelium discoideum AX4]|uniref:Uncharacterized protein n=1 Tax=Dictyostelium discoideum TaxID=44689 RepID=Q54JN9_DICDI|nr:hypothetical protein DDB_G0287941 [Dictyostelium discoideum AX4]EAL63477.1 hypothetical protein DDB_G0287941 [Dictyostelium discoideum AX4]|eukprot:XP_636973.1 hypothetical protein DDB_G0287941 [Dictyostelium discoideum AX4]